jgi:hypothetical protein
MFRPSVGPKARPPACETSQTRIRGGREGASWMVGHYILPGNFSRSAKWGVWAPLRADLVRVYRAGMRFVICSLGLEIAACRGPVLSPCRHTMQGRAALSHSQRLVGGQRRSTFVRSPRYLRDRWGDSHHHTPQGRRAYLTPSSYALTAPLRSAGPTPGRECAPPGTASSGSWPPPEARLPSTPG